MRIGLIRVNKSHGNGVRFNKTSKISNRFNRRGGALVKNMKCEPNSDGADCYNKKAEMERLRSSIKSLKIGSGKNRFANF